MSSPPPDADAPKPPDPPWRAFARAPLAPVALAATLGLLADRYGGVSEAAALAVGLGALLAWVVGRDRPSAPVWLAVAAGGLAAAHHHAHRHTFAPDDIGVFAPDAPTPARVRGTLAEEPVHHRPPKPSPLVTEQAVGTTLTTLAVTAVETRDGWAPASGRVRLTVEGRLDGLHGGDAVEVTGRLSKPPRPSNPGERDVRSALLDQRITAVVRVEKSAAGVTRLGEGWRGSLTGWLGVVRGWGVRALQDSLPPDESGLAAALLLGDTAALDRSEWDRYVRTGVVHVLAISGQHLVVFGAFVWLVLKVCGVRRRHGAWVVAGVLLGYALLTGGRPSAVRAAVMVCAACAAIVARRPLMPANAFALAWLVIVAVNPTDPFTAGCQLSFLSVFVKNWTRGNESWQPAFFARNALARAFLPECPPLPFLPVAVGRRMGVRSRIRAAARKMRRRPPGGGQRRRGRCLSMPSLSRSEPVGVLPFGLREALARGIFGPMRTSSFISMIGSSALRMPDVRKLSASAAPRG